jgi:hypothetical protein
MKSQDCLVLIKLLWQDNKRLEIKKSLALKYYFRFGQIKDANRVEKIDKLIQRNNKLVTSLQYESSKMLSF